MQAQMSELEQQKREMFVQPSKQEQTTDNISYPTYHYVKEHSSFVYVEKNIQKAQTTIFPAPDHQPEFKVAV
jgi:sec-independent protein translocase protein TatB